MATNYADGGGIVVDTTSPSTSDDRTRGFFVNKIWRDSSTGRHWICTDDAIGAAVWREMAILPADVAALDMLFVASDGTVDTLAIGTAGQILAVNGDATGYEWIANA